MPAPRRNRRTTIWSSALGLSMVLVVALALPGGAAPAPDPSDPGTSAPSAPASVDPAVTSALEETGSAQVIVQFDSTATAQDAVADERIEGEVLATDHPVVSATVDGDGLDALVEAPGSQIVVPDRAHTVSLNQSVTAIDAPDAWAAGLTGAGQRVAILDTGVLASHPFLGGRVSAQACFSGDPTDTWPSGFCPGADPHQAIGGNAATPCPFTLSSACSHGTHVAGILAGSGGPAEAPSGVAPEAHIVAVQVFSEDEEGYVIARDSDLLEALAWVATQQTAASPIAAVNMSLGGYPSRGFCDGRASDAILKVQIDALADVGIAVVAASGNNTRVDDKSHVDSPACISSAIAVGATDDARNVKRWSMSASPLDLLAPGVNIRSSKFTGAAMTPIYADSSGTSMATPHVAGALALIAQARGTLPVPSALEALTRSGIPTTDPLNGLTRPFIQVEPALTVPLTPLGDVDSLTSSGGSVSLMGWALDPDTFGAAEVEVRIGGVPATRTAATSSRPDIATRYPSFGPLHGYTIAPSGLPSGPHSVCLAVLDTTTAVRTQLACSNVLVTGGSPAPVSRFSDVHPGDGFYEAIAWLADSDITSGYADGTFHPGETLTRQTMAAFFYRLAGSPTFTPPDVPTFSDVGTGAPFRNEIEWAAANGITLGNTDGTFTPLATVSRQSFAAFLFRYDDPDSFVVPALATFPDVPVAHAFREPIEWLAANGVADGRGDGSFGGSQPVSRQGLAAFLSRYELPA